MYVNVFISVELRTVTERLYKLYQANSEPHHQNGNVFLYVTERVLVHFALSEWECLVKKSQLQVHVQKNQVNSDPFSV